jgi:hypothetical protein
VRIPMTTTWAWLRGFLAVWLAGGILALPANALVTLNDGHDRIHVSASAGMAYDSNVFAQNGGKGDVLYTTSFAADYQRRAGWIGVTANIGISGAHFGSITGQDYSDPTMSLELNKGTGRTTGAITLSAARESRADAAVNTRNSSWNLNYGASFKYHIIGTWDLSGSMNYSQRKYSDAVTFSNLNTFASSLDLFHVMSSERDLILGYRYRYNDAPGNVWSTDHNFSAGIHGKLIRGMNGTLRAGYQVRQPHGAPTAAGGGKFSSWTASGSTSYPINKKANLSASVSKDFSITATDSSVDSLMASIDGQYAYSSHWSLSTSLGWGTTKFLGDGGRVVLDPGPPPLLGKQRQDTNVNWSTSVNYSLNEHLKFAFSYVWFKNWSTSSFADFVRNSWTMNVSSRW